MVVPSVARYKSRLNLFFLRLVGNSIPRSKFLELGGFDELLWPLYHEDIDLSYRAWRRGWRILYEPKACCTTWAVRFRLKYKQNELRAIVTQNTFLIQWKNIDDPAMRREHLAWLPSRLARAALTKDLPFLRGVQSALRRTKAMHIAREREAPGRCIPDKEAFARIIAEIEGVDKVFSTIIGAK